MKSRLPVQKSLTLAALSAVIFMTSCGPQGSQSNSNAANSNSANSNASSKAASGSRPADATPMGQTAPGFYMAGPTGNVTLRFTAPLEGQTLQGNSVAPTFDITGYPVYEDADRKKGQHIHVILDNEPYEADHHPDQPFIPDNGVFANLKPGLHTLRAFAAREWHESIKQTDGTAFDMVTFTVGSKTPATPINKTAPLLTYSRPKGEYRWKEDPRGVLFDFYISNATISGNEYKVQYTINQKKSVLTRWEPIWWKWEELGPGEHKVSIELLDKNNKPVPFKVGGVDYNRTTRTFKILSEGEQPSAPAGGANRNTANRNGASGNRNSR